MKPADVAFGGEVDVDLFRDCKEEQARILHSPIDVRHGKVTLGGQGVSDELTMNFSDDFVSGAVNCQDSVQVCLKLASAPHF